MAILFPGDLHELGVFRLKAYDALGTRDDQLAYQFLLGLLPVSPCQRAAAKAKLSAGSLAFSLRPKGSESVYPISAAGALARWTLAGFPVRTDAEIERIERELCRPCDRYVAGRCAECGCRVNESRLAVVNKVAMATERCPKGKW